ncbi:MULTISPECIES: response regulator [Alteromonas]|jgi:two-component system chemotaxis response regulator CheY|uniref:Response regulator n=1 Tax=Alteromonas stellipolaris TaxID=233316 RepID=A0AAW7Z4X6_9ALTE|nr:MULTISPECIES: response regulator [Alteromonas]AMJ91939.1 two-component system response regulator [Alteromonas sp. Mac2]AMJ75652.1 two-component system response regulator [Alteromonas stellipolaris]AMJ88076.1 two-component system response regulator [Alteromonas sp. Mac1]AMJ95754.1 two-component system response regulator [Alteromonas stellipolaris]ANB21212.1 two-component system response regulator [Alteromonas stellipolaris]
MALSVLVADDSKLSRRSVKKSLPPELDYDISEATNGQEAIDLLAENTFDLVLLDLTMPEVDGVDVLEYLSKREDAFPNVIVISADFQPEKQRIVLSLGAQRFIRKPLDKEELAMTMFELGYL